MTESQQDLPAVVQLLPISPGSALGPAHVLAPAPIPHGYARIKREQLAHERQRLQTAIDAAERESDDLRQHLAQHAGSAEADIFSAQKLMLRDPELLAEVEALMAEQCFSAEAAWRETIARQSEELASLADPALAACAADVRDMGARVLYHLHAPGDQAARDMQHPGPSLLLAYDLTPSQMARLDPAQVLGICTVEGGPTTHAAIIARALEIPVVAGLDAAALARLHDGLNVGIDGTRGLLYLRPDDQQRAQLSAGMRMRGARTYLHAHWRTRPGATADGHPVPIYANVGDSASAREAAEGGAQGIGLLRTEFLFGQCTTLPSEQEETEGYVELFQAFAQRARFHTTIVARTLDAGADKSFPALEPLVGSRREANPALGLRGARIHLLHTGLLRQQLRALLQAAQRTQITLHILFPMIATLTETRRLKQALATVRDNLRAEGIAPEVRIGVMIETPAAVWLADALAREVDFLSVGANDLLQYTLAADRTNSRVMSLFGPLEPALWRSLAHVIQAAGSCPVAVCGEIAADPRYGPLLAGLGAKELSVSPPALARSKEALQRHEMAYWRAKARELLQAETAADIEAMLQGV